MKGRFVLKTGEKVLIAAVIVLFTIFACVYAINIYVIKTAEKYILSDIDDLLQNGEYDCIIVPGAGLRPDGTPSYMLKDRLDRAIELYKLGVTDKIVMSGDHGRSEYDEVNAMKKYAVEKGIPEENIFLDHAGFCTYDTMYRAKAVFCVKNPIIVTQKYHLYRAVYNAKELGLEPRGIACDTVRYAGQNMRILRESAARVKDFFGCIFKPLPKYLGEEINIISVPASATDG